MKYLLAPLILLVINSTCYSNDLKPSCTDILKSFMSKSDTSLIDRSLIKFHQKKLIQEIEKCQHGQCDQIEIHTILSEHLISLRSELNGNIIFSGLFIGSGMSITYLSDILPDSLMISLAVLYGGFTSSFLNHHYAKVLQWGHLIRSGKKTATGIKRSKNTELQTTYASLRENLSLTDEEAKDSIAHAIESMRAPLLQFNLHTDPQIINNLIRIFAGDLVNLKLLHIHISENQESLIRTLKYHLQNYIGDEVFIKKLLQELKSIDQNFDQNEGFYQKIIKSVLDETA